jgi:hypothetical protein
MRRDELTSQASVNAGTHTGNRNTITIPYANLVPKQNAITIPNNNAFFWTRADADIFVHTHAYISSNAISHPHAHTFTCTLIYTHTNRHTYADAGRQSTKTQGK